MIDVSNYKPSLCIRVLWISDGQIDAEGKATRGPIDLLADSLYSTFNRSIDNPLERGLGIPVFFHVNQPPEPKVLEQSKRTILVVLLDDRMVIDSEWNEGLMKLGKGVSESGSQHRLYPVALSPNSFNIGPTVAVTNFIRLQRLPSKEHVSRLSSMLTHELCRLLLSNERSEKESVPVYTRLSPAPVNIFLSHAKLDGEELAEDLRDYIESTSTARSFFDTNDIAPGFDFRSELEGNIERSVLIVLQTDNYVSRTWCRREVLWAKSKGCPLVVINAVRNKEERSFPYLGNAPTLRIHNDDPTWCVRAIEVALREMLRHLWFRANLSDLTKVGLVPEGLEPSPCPPEILTLLTRQKTLPRTGLIYPDPPLGAEERFLLSQAAPDLTFTTPTSCAGQNPHGDESISLNNMLIGLSISDSPDLSQLGMGQAHLKNAMLELARYLLAQGARLAYGGDLRVDGFTEQLLELIWTYNNNKDDDDFVLSAQQKTDLAANRLANYVAWPIYLDSYSTAILAQHHLKGVFKLIPPPIDLELSDVQQSTSVLPDSPEHRYWWFRSLTAMREQMANDIQARVLLGGQIRGYAGGIPGLVEETLFALRQSQPVFLLGGFGGCTRVIIDALEGRRPKELTGGYQSEGKNYKYYTAFLDYVKKDPNNVEINYQAMVNELEQFGIIGLNNGLSIIENRQLFETPYIPAMVSLVLKGLATYKGK